MFQLHLYSDFTEGTKFQEKQPVSVFLDVIHLSTPTVSTKISIILGMYMNALFA